MIKNRCYFLIAFAAAFFLLATGPVSAVSITESPDVITRGGQVTITMNDLNDGSQFSILIDGEFNVAPGERFSFETNSFMMPIALNNGQISATSQGTTVNAFSLQKSGGATYNVMDSSDANGYYSISDSGTIPSGLINYIRMGGSARSDVSTVKSTISLYGTKQGPEDSQLTFNVDGIDNGIIHLTVLVDGYAALSTKTITVGSGLIPVTTTTTVPTSTTPVPTGTTTAATTTVPPTGTPQPTATATQTTTTGTQTGTTTAATTTATGAATSATTATGATAAATTTTALPAKTFYSADRKVSLDTLGIDYAGFLMVKGAAIPADWLAISDIYTIVPDTLVFSPRATLAFTIPGASGADYAYFVGRYENSRWRIVPSAAGTNTVETEISSPGTYGLMAYKPESTLPATSVATTQGGVPASGTSPAAQVTVRGTPRIASVAAAAAPSPAAATPAPWLPMSPLLVFGALAICLTLVLRRE